MSEIDLGDGCFAGVQASGNVSMSERYPDLKIWDSVSFSPDQMDALCKWWLEQREQQAIEAHKAGRSRPIGEIISDLRKGREQPEAKEQQP